MAGTTFRFSGVPPFGLHVQRVFEVLASAPRRKILALLTYTGMSVGEMAARFSMTGPSISQHLSVLEGAGLVASEKRGRFVFCRRVGENLVNSLHGFVQDARPVSIEAEKCCAQDGE